MCKADANSSRNPDRDTNSIAEPDPNSDGKPYSHPYSHPYSFARLNAAIE